MVREQRFGDGGTLISSYVLTNSLTESGISACKVAKKKLNLICLSQQFFPDLIKINSCK